MSDATEKEWTPLTENEIWGGLLISLFGGFGLGTYRFREEAEGEESLRRIPAQKSRAVPSVSRRGNMARGDIWRFKHIQAMPSQHGHK